MAAHKGPASFRPRCTRSGSSVAAIPVYLPSAIFLTPFKLDVTSSVIDYTSVAQLSWIPKCIIFKKLFHQTSTFCMSTELTSLVRYLIKQFLHGNIWILYFGEANLSVRHNRDCSSDRSSLAQWKMVCVSADFKYLWFFLLYTFCRSLL
jgi:hypothetical protein